MGGETAMVRGFVPAANGDSETVLSAPLPASMPYAKMLAAPRLETYRKLPPEPTTTPIGWLPVAKGEPAMGVSAPLVVLTVQAEQTSPARWRTS